MWSSERKQKEDQKCHGKGTPKSRSCKLCGKQKRAVVGDICREMGVSQQAFAFYSWKSVQCSPV